VLDVCVGSHMAGLSDEHARSEAILDVSRHLDRPAFTDCTFTIQHPISREYATSAFFICSESLCEASFTRLVGIIDTECSSIPLVVRVGGAIGGRTNRESTLLALMADVPLFI